MHLMFNLISFPFSSLRRLAFARRHSFPTSHFFILLYKFGAPHSSTSHPTSYYSTNFIHLAFFIQLTDQPILPTHLFHHPIYFTIQSILPSNLFCNLYLPTNPFHQLIFTNQPISSTFIIATSIFCITYFIIQPISQLTYFINQPILQLT